MKLQEATQKVQTLALQMLLAEDAGLTALAVGSKDGGPISGATDFTVTGFVRKKLTMSALAAEGGRPFSAVYAAAAGAPAAETDIDVVESGSAFTPQASPALTPVQQGLFGGTPAIVDTQKFFATLRIGIGITNATGQYPQGLSVGTLGFFLQDGQGRRFLVSNNHVIGGSNAAQAGEAIEQPGTLDMTLAEIRLLPTLAALENAHTIARLTTQVQLAFRTPQNVPVNQVDAALAELTNSGRGMQDLDRLSFGGSLRGVAAPYQLGPNGALVGSARVYKVGRTTGFTEGVVTNIAGTTLVPYQGGTAFFAGQIVIQPTADNVGPFSDRGDSGSGIVNEDHELVGLLFAGSGARTLVNPIAEVLAQLGTASGIAGLQVIV